MDSKVDFQVVNPPRSPYWRDPKYQLRRQRRNLVVALSSIICIVVTLMPPRTSYFEAISLQIARGERLAWAMFILMGCTVMSALPTLIRARRYASGFFCVLVGTGLWALASTDPASMNHLAVFVFLATAILAWIWGLWASLLDGRLLFFAIAATAGAIGCVFSFGVGERMMIVSSLCVLNTLLLSDLLE
ncbi:MAG: hypothetical protein H7Y17_06845 [Chlorobia bacterium]|nr:hypothetical protein [Fimbriimonadaceae bacterium]